MLRDTRRSQGYFSELLADLDEAIIETQEALDDGDFSLPAEQVDTAQQLYQLAIMRAVAHYSAGTPIIALRSIVEAILPLRQQLSRIADTLPPEHQVYRRPFEVFGGQGKASGSANINRYIYAIWWLSLLVACDIDNSHIQLAIKLIGNQGRDALLDSIAVSLGDEGREQASELLYPERYQQLYNAMSNSAEDRVGLIGAFLDSWYENNQDADWYDNHLCDCEFEYTDYYTGYWSFEAVLIVNLLRVDDKAFQANLYYPADLVR
ncbi:PoNe immunity protein domain-containing protein [Photobacterium alginatilyticum]|uniref:PoNe immunity protein domain-containing protein n=1 Tax=Photobacterium alginatilyticum TaxID=1775171 RepID=UPI004068A339